VLRNRQLTIPPTLCLILEIILQMIRLYLYRISVCFSFILLISCDISNRDLTLINSTPYNIHYRIYFDTLSIKSNDWYIGDFVNPYDTVQPHTAFGGKGALEFSMKRRSRDSSLYLFYTTKAIANESDLILTVEQKEYRKLKFSISNLKRTNWTIHLVE
jgi:hypothetical protein